MSGDEVASALRWSASKVSRIETNRIGIKPADVARLLDLYAVDDARRRQLIALSAEPEARGWWSAYIDSIPSEYATYISLEDQATTIQCWSPELIHGLLQTQEYAQAVMSREFGSPPVLSPRTIHDRVDVRMRRQALLTGEGKRFSFILDEGTLLRRHGSSQVMSDQLTQLEQVSRLPNVTVRVLAFDGPHPLVLQGSFGALEFAPVQGIDVGAVVYLEKLTGDEFVEDEAAAHQYRLAFERLAEVALNPDESRRLIARTRNELWS